MEPVQCNVCKKEVKDNREINRYPNEEDWELINIEQAKKLKQQLGIMTCSCGAEVSVEQGDVPVNFKDETGKVISEEAAIHMSKYRVACCPSCAKQFCGGC